MNKDITICDICEKRTDDRFSEKGWVRLEPTTISITAGRAKGGMVKWKAWLQVLNPKDFCSSTCFTNFVRAVLSGNAKR